MNHSPRIDDYISPLRTKGATGVDEYKQKLRGNARNQKRLDDLLFEGRAALMFLYHGWRVELRESPDLGLSLNDELLYAEVKHFYEKEQDRLDGQAMLTAINRPYMVPVGDLIPTEGLQAEQQICQVAVKKARAGQYMKGAPNILVVESSSESLELMVGSAVSQYDNVARAAKEPCLLRLSGIMLVNTCLIARPESWNIEFCRTSCPTVPLSNTLIQALESICLG